MSAYCTSCGAPMEAEDRHCRRCGRLQTGTLLVRSLPSSAEPEPEPEPELEPDEGMHRRPDLRLLAAAGLGALLLVFLVGLLVGRVTAPGRETGGGQLTAAGPASGSPAAGAARSQAPASAPPAATPTPTPASQAQFSLVRANITNNGRCTTANGCGVAATFKNKGSSRASGTARLSVGNADGSTTYASCTAPIPATDPGATVDVSCIAQSPELAAFLPSGNLVYPHATAG